MANKHKTVEWFRDFNRQFWLKGDDTGQDEAEFIRKALGLRKGQSVLDAPCGAGRVAVHIARAGCRVTGVDLTPSHIRRARARFHREGLTGTFLRCDMRALAFESTFDALFNWLGSFGYFSDEENLDVLRRFAAAIRPGGRVLVDQRNREHLLRHFRPRGRFGEAVTMVSWNARRQRFQTTFTRTIHGVRQRWGMSIRAYTPAQMRRLFELAGLTVEATYGSIAGEPYKRSSPRLVTVGRKAKSTSRLFLSRK
jgi:cyclopropane fatty-acyl-phospholipid synthase-like methyltransferase